MKYLKMLAIIFGFFIIICSVSGTNTRLNLIQQYCEIKFTMEQLCLYYKFQNDCYPWNLPKCDVQHYAYDEPKCPLIECSVSKH